MQTYTMYNGDKFVARDAAELVKLMRKESFAHTRNMQEYMEEVAEAAKMQDRHAIIPTDSVDKFVAALLDSGFIKLVENND